MQNGHSRESDGCVVGNQRKRFGATINYPGQQMSNNNNNNPICKAPECQKTSVAGAIVLDPLKSAAL